MKKLLVIPLLVLFAAALMAGNDTITVDRATNIFNTEVTSSSSTMRAVRVGRINTVPSIVLNQAGYAPVVLDAVDGVLRYNGTSLTTATFTGTDMAISGDLSVGDSAIITGSTTLSSTLQVDGAASLNSTLDVDGNFVSGAAGYRSTNTASSGVWAFPAAVSIAGAVTGPTAITATKLIASGAGSVGLYSRSLSQLNAITPAAAGQVYYCNDCVHSAVCVSSGTGVGAFVASSSPTVHCDVR